MITYSIKKTDCLSALMNAVTTGRCRYWMSGKIPISQVNSIIPKLISKYGLASNDNDRVYQRRSGLPVWTLVIHYNPSFIGEIEFWLMTTGYRQAARSKSIELEDIQSLNQKLMAQENLKPIVTKNPLEFLTFGEYVLGLYISYDDLKDSIDNDYLFPYNYGIPLDPNHAKHPDYLSFRSMNGLKTSLDLGSKLSPNEEKKYIAIKENFGFLYLKDSDSLDLNRAKAVSILKKKYGVTVEDETPYNDIVKLLSKHLNRTNNQYVHIFKRKSNKKIRFTWYLNNDFLQKMGTDIEGKIKLIPTRPQQFEDSMRRLYARGNFHGVRYQIGKISGRVKKIVKENYPIIYNKLSFPQMLHYVRFSPTPYKNFKEFQQACINETIIINNNKDNRDINQKRLKKLRTAIRHKNPQLLDASPTTLNTLIKQHDKAKVEYNILPTDKEIEIFLSEHKEMDPRLISDTY
jgi:hypothetical protein